MQKSVKIYRTHKLTGILAHMMLSPAIPFVALNTSFWKFGYRFVSSCRDKEQWADELLLWARGQKGIWAKGHKGKPIEKSVHTHRCECPEWVGVITFNIGCYGTLRVTACSLVMVSNRLGVEDGKRFVRLPTASDWAWWRLIFGYHSFLGGVLDWDLTNWPFFLLNIAQNTITVQVMIPSVHICIPYPYPCCSLQQRRPHSTHSLPTLS